MYFPYSSRFKIHNYGHKMSITVLKLNLNTYIIKFEFDI